MSETPEQEGARILAEIEAMSRENAASESILRAYVRSAQAQPWTAAIYVMISPQYEWDYTGSADAATRLFRRLTAGIESVLDNELKRVARVRSSLGIACAQRAARHVAGDRPADLRDDEITREMLIDPEYRAARRDALGRALLLRRERDIVRETHAKVHRELGYAGPSHGTQGCKWCEESGR